MKVQSLFLLERNIFLLVDIIIFRMCLSVNFYAKSSDGSKKGFSLSYWKEDFEKDYHKVVKNVYA
jgi:hypothetical protein